MLGLLTGVESRPSPSRARTRLAWALIMVCLGLFALQAGAATLTAGLDRDSLTLGETATLSLTISGGPQNVPAPSVPVITNLEIKYLGPSSQISINNGQVNSTTTHNFTVAPRQSGDFVIPAITTTVGSEKLSSKPLTLKVSKPGAPSQADINSGSLMIFMKLALSKKQVFVGEVFVAELQLYVRSGIQGVSGFNLTSFPADGFNVGKYVQGGSRQVQIANTVYTAIPLPVPIRALKAGSFALGPVTANLVVEVASSRRDVFDPFNMFGGEQKRFTVATEPDSVQVLALPTENVPSSFNGAVGSFTMNVTAGPTNISVGDPVTVRVQLNGHGAWEAVTLPDQPGWSNFKIYPQPAKFETTDGLALQGTKTFEQLLAPESSDIKSLPPVMFSFFDPDQKAYRTLASGAVPLFIKPSASASPVVLAASRTAQDTPLPPDIVPNKQRLGAIAQIAPPLVQQTWFLALQGLPVLAWLSAWVWRKRTDQLANNPRLRRQRQVERVIQEGLAQLRQLAAQNKSEEFFATLFRLLQEQLGERLDLPATAITEAVIEERLRPRGVNETTLTSLQELFHTCNLARYAPSRSSQELSAAIPKLETTLEALKGLTL